jgi:SpoVK/Ycf46/Vps4 family AAA+-type ATPase
MAASEMVQELIRAHVAGDADRFRTIALQLAASEARVGHRRVAGRIRDLVEQDTERAKASPTPPTPLARPPRDLRGLLATSYPKERLRDIVLAPTTHRVLERLLQEHRSRVQLVAHGLAPRRKMLFYGPPGCGKTLAASVVAGELALPLIRIRVETIFSRYLGETAGLLASIFEEMERVRGVYLFDEFDAIARRRSEQHDVGEAKRVVATFLQLLDSESSDSLVVAATNVTEQIDRAVFRRFDDVAEFQLPDLARLKQLLTMRTAATGLTKQSLPSLAKLALGLSYADVARAVDDARKSMVLSGRKRLLADDLRHNLLEIQNRPATS